MQTAAGNKLGADIAVEFIPPGGQRTLHGNFFPVLHKGKPPLPVQCFIHPLRAFEQTVPPRKRHRPAGQAAKRD